ncbi:uncharacterized protein TNIN_356071 [Trichonephila inaurata madagascariensis]|uniref:Uncharacterized protein n=1 Tax=Trichonephila inaurata madagascariensis TaxID=2747483 RepID=A0A8X6XV18_9ARAC|nr:uncharacterized protein TNIN_356071 [Trichonephila inaurata madagascariensis]
MAKKDQNKAWNLFRCYPTPDNMIAFNRARACAMKIHWQRKRESWIKYVSNITCSTSSKEVWNKIRKFSGKYSASPVSMLVSNGVSVNTIPDIANTLAETFAKTSSCNNYTPAFQALKRREERVKLNFSSSNEEGYNSPLTLLELRAALHRSGNTAAGADRTSLLRLYRALIRSKLDYGSVVYSSACKSLLKILDPVHHQALRLCLGAFLHHRLSPSMLKPTNPH